MPKKTRKSFRISPSRRDFLRIIAENGSIEIRNIGKRFYSYSVPGQIHRKISVINFNRIVDNGYLILDSVDGVCEFYIPTRKTTKMLGDRK